MAQTSRAGPQQRGHPALRAPRTSCLQSRLAVLAATGALLAAFGATAEVRVDGSIGPNPAGTLVPSGSYDALFSTYLITQDWGERSGRNLFHSFLDFNLVAGEKASFVETTESGSIDNIVARVTGGRSMIDGLIRSQIAGASLFLLNPAGFLFSANSTLDLSGSGYFSTAPLLRFPDTDFQAGAALPPVELSASDPTHFGFLIDQPAAPIELALRAGFVDPVPAGKTLAFVGGEVSIEGDNFTQQSIRTAETLALAAVANADADVPIKIASFNVSDFVPGELGAIRVSNDAQLILSGNGGAFSSGRVVIRGGSFVLGSGAPGDESVIEACVSDSCDNGAIAARELVVDVKLAGDEDLAQADFVIEKGSRIALSSLADPLGDVRVEAPSFSLRGDNGNFPHFQVSSGLASTRAPNLTLVGNELEVVDGAEILSANGALGTPGGTLRLEVDQVRIADQGAIRSVVVGGATGGDIEVVGDNLIVDGGAIESGGGGAGGDIRVVTSQDVVVRGFGGIVSGSDPFGLSATSTLPGGDVRVTAERIVVASSDSDQPFTPSQISALATSNAATAPSGDVILTAREITLEGGQVITSTSGASDAGSIQISGPLVRGAQAVELAPAELLRIEGTTDVAGKVFPAGLFARTSGSGSAGSIEVAARTLEVRAGGEVSARAAVGVTGNAGRIRIAGAEKVKLTSAPSEGSIFDAAAPTLSVSGANGSGAVEDAGSIEIQTQQLELLAGGGVVADTTGSAPAGSILVEADEVLIDGVFTPDGAGPTESGLFSQSASAGDGNAGDITLRIGESLTVSDRAQISVEAVDSSFAGNIRIEGDNADVLLASGAAITGKVGSPGVPQPGDDPTADIVIDGVHSLKMKSGAIISVQTDGSGRGGVVDIQTRGNTRLADGAKITSSTVFTGDAGDIVLSTADLEVTSGAAITAQTDSSGAGGKIAINARGNATLSEGGRITSSSFGAGAAGAVDLVATDLLIDGGNLPAETASAIAAQTRSTGPGGTITVTTRNSTTLARKGQISSSSLSDAANAGDAGNVVVDGGRELRLTGDSSITTETSPDETAGASGGKITLIASDLIYLEDSRVSTNVFQGEGGGGDIGIPVLPEPAGAVAPEGEPSGSAPAPPELLVLNRSTISANAQQGPGGNILIEAGTIFRSAESVIEAVSKLGVDGNVDISAPDSDLAGQVVPLTTRFFDASELMLPACAARTSRAGSFTVQTRAVRPPPDAPLPARMAYGAAGSPDPTRGAACSS